MKKWFTTALIVASALFVLAFIMNQIVKGAVENGVKWATGLDLKMGSLNVSPLSSTVHIKNLKLLNPEGFPKGAMVHLPEIKVRYDLPALFSGTLHLPQLKIHLKEFSVAKNAAGASNLDKLKNVTKSSTDLVSKKSKGRAMKLVIDELDLKIERVTFKHYSEAGPPKTKEFNVNIEAQYYDITSPTKLVALIVGKALLGTTIGPFVNLDAQFLDGAVGDAAAHSKQIAAQALGSAKEKAGEALKASSERLKNVSGDAQKKLASAADSAGDAIGAKTKKLWSTLKQ